MAVFERYSAFSYGNSLVLNGRIILVDEYLDPDVRERIKNLDTTDDEKLTFLDDRDLAAYLEEFLKRITQKEKEILFVFPGNGANFPKKLSSVWRKFPSAGVYAKRLWQPGSDPISFAGTILPDFFLVTSIATIVVVDDVISSGRTLKILHRNNAWRFPRAKWIGATWISQLPQSRSKSGIIGYEQIFASCVVGKNSGSKVPINSLSTLRADVGIATSYAQRHFTNPKAFIHLISQNRRI